MEIFTARHLTYSMIPSKNTRLVCKSGQASLAQETRVPAVRESAELQYAADAYWATYWKLCSCAWVTVVVEVELVFAALC